MSHVEIYTTPFCGFCIRAKRLLDKKGVEYREIDVMRDPAAKREMLQRSEGRTTVPQIFIGGKGIGGCDELFELEFDEELDALLAAK